MLLIGVHAAYEEQQDVGMASEAVVVNFCCNFHGCCCHLYKYHEAIRTTASLCCMNVEFVHLSLTYWLLNRKGRLQYVPHCSSCNCRRRYVYRCAWFSLFEVQAAGCLSMDLIFCARVFRSSYILRVPRPAKQTQSALPTWAHAGPAPLTGQILKASRRSLGLARAQSCKQSPGRHQLYQNLQSTLRVLPVSRCLSLSLSFCVRLCLFSFHISLSPSLSLSQAHGRRNVRHLRLWCCLGSPGFQTLGVEYLRSLSNSQGLHASGEPLYMNPSPAVRSCNALHALSTKLQAVSRSGPTAQPCQSSWTNIFTGVQVVPVITINILLPLIRASAPKNKECESQISGKYAPGPSLVLLLGPPGIVMVSVIVTV